MRQQRIKEPGVACVYHCISRIVGAAFLLEGEREKEVLRNQIWKVADFCGVEVLTYCIMSNHVHILVRTPDEAEVASLADSELIRRTRRIYAKDKAEFFEVGLTDPDPGTRRRFRANLLSRMGDVSLFMKELKQRFSIWYNRTHKRVGTLWAERFKSALVQDDPFALSTIAAYIELNPVRAGLASDPSEYRFCGYAEAMGGFKPARAGIEAIMGGRLGWTKAISKYRVVIFGKGEHYDSAKPDRAADLLKAQTILREGGRVTREEALRCRVRYFSDGAVLGSREFVQGFFERHREQFGERRRDGPRTLKGADWEGLACIRNLRKEVFG